MKWPDGYDDDSIRRDVPTDFDDGLLLGGSSEDTVVPGYDFRNAGKARGALQDLATFVDRHAETGATRSLSRRSRYAARVKHAQVWELLFET